MASLEKSGNSLQTGVGVEPLFMLRCDRIPIMLTWLRQLNELVVLPKASLSKGSEKLDRSGFQAVTFPPICASGLRPPALPTRLSPTKQRPRTGDHNEATRLLFAVYLDAFPF